MKYFLLLIGILCLPFTGQAKKNRMGENIDVTHYEIHLNEINFTDHTISVVTTVTLEATENLSSFDLELKNLTVASITSDDMGISDFSQSGDVLTINLASQLVSGSSASFTITYSGSPFNESWGGFHWNGNYAFNLGVGFDSQPHNLGKAWFPCVDDFSDKATYEMFVTVPNAKKAICGGTFVETVDNGDGTSTWHWNISQDIPAYLNSVAVGEYELWEDTFHGMNGDIPITIYVRPSQINKVDATFANVKEIMTFYENCFGPYPFNRIGYVGTSIGCMEHVDNIALANSLITGTTNLESENFIAHELSHMWFGDKVTCATAGDMWLNEGFATFCSYYYLSELYGEDLYKEEMDGLINNVIKGCHLTEGWIPLNNMPLNLTYGTTVYDKGATVIHTMMNYLGRERFNEAMQYYLTQYQYDVATSENLRDAVTEFTGIDMTGFFDTWVFTAGNPHYLVESYNVTPNGNRFDVNITMKQKHRGVEHTGNGVIYELAFMDNNWNVYTDTVCWDGETGHSVKTLDFEPVAVFGDYYNKTADARSEKNYVIKENSTINYTLANFKAVVEEVEDSVFLRVEHHWVGPDSNEEPTPGLTISGDRYWTIYREDVGSAKINGTFKYLKNATYDANLIQSQNDSVVLLYRVDASDIWHNLVYEYQGVWNYGMFTVDELLPGDYTLAAWDKSFLSQEEIQTKYMRTEIYPNPASKQVNLNWKDKTDGMIAVKDINSKTVKLIPFRDSNFLILSVEDFVPGLYYINRCSLTGEVLSTNKLIVK